MQQQRQRPDAASPPWKHKGNASEISLSGNNNSYKPIAVRSNEGVGRTSVTSAGTTKTKALASDFFLHMKGQQQTQGIEPSLSQPAHKKNVDMSVDSSTGSASVSSEDYSYSYSKSGSGSYSYSYSHTSESEEDKSTDGDGGQTSTSSYIYSHNSDPRASSKETVSSGPSKPHQNSVSSSESVTQTYSGSVPKGNSSGTYYGSNSTGDSASSQTGSSVGDSYSYSSGVSAGSGRMTLTSSSGTFSASSSLTNGGSMNHTKPFTESDSYSYSYSQSSRDTVGLASRRNGSVTERESIASNVITSSGESQAKSGSSSHSSRSSCTGTTRSSLMSSSLVPDNKAEKDLPPLHPATKSSVTSTTSASTTSLIQCSSSVSSFTANTESSSTVEKSSVSSNITRIEKKIAAEKVAPIELRELIVLSASPEEMPRVPLLPHSCMVPRGSTNDILSQFLTRLSEVQAHLLRGKAPHEGPTHLTEATGADASANVCADTTLKSIEEAKKNKKGNRKKKVTVMETPIAGEEPEKETKSNTLVADVPLGHFNKKSIMFALKAVGVPTLKARSFAIKNVALPLSHDAMLLLLESHVHQTLMRRLMTMILSHDKFSSGEVSLTIALDILGRSGIAFRVVEDITLSLLHDISRSRSPLLRVTQRVSCLRPPVAIVEGEEPVPKEVVIEEVLIDVCGSSLRRESIDVYWDKEKGDVYVGSRVVARNITCHQLARDLYVQIEGLIHVCLVVDAHIVYDREHCAVVYTPLLASLLPAVPDGMPNAKPIIVENAIKSVVDPIKYLNDVVAHSRLMERHFGSGEDSVLRDTLPDRRVDVRDLAVAITGTASTMIPPQYQCVDWAPKPSVDGTCFETTDPRTVNDLHCDIELKKLRLAEPVPATAHCYCLVSARKASCEEWMTTVVVPVARVASSKKGGFKWTFNKENSDCVFFAGGKADTLYIEACYDIQESTGEIVTWCIGHVTMTCCGAKSGKLCVLHGSLLSENRCITVEEKQVKFSCRLFSFLPRKVNATPAKSLSVVVKRVNLKALPPRESLPAHYLVLQRHVPLMAKLRDAMTSSSGPCGGPTLHVLRQQWVHCCFTVAARPELMDVLQELWDRTLCGKMGAKPKGSVQQHKMLLTLAARVAAVYNGVAADKNIIVDILARGAAIPFPISPEAPQRPVCV